MKLFESPKLHQSGPIKGGQSHYEYFRDSDREDVAARRDLLQAWFDTFPTPYETDFLKRFQSREDEQHQGAIWELILYRRMVNSGCDVLIAPKVPSGKCPDFLIVFPNGARFYLEATVVFDVDPRAQRRKEKFLEALNRIESKYFDLMKWENAADFPEQVPRASSLVSMVEKWLSTLDWEAVRAHHEERGHLSLPKKMFKYGSWTIEFTAFPKNPNVIAKGITRTTRGLGTGMHEDKIGDRIERAVRHKAQKYPNLDSSLVVAVNVQHWNTDQLDKESALFGKEGVKYLLLPDIVTMAPYKEVRKGGVFAQQKNQRYDRVAAVLFGPDVGLWNFDTCPLSLIPNPFLNWSPPNPPFAFDRTVDAYANVQYDQYTLITN